jgi:predicted RNA-binding Zn-ribbon protein involved in translation (DUF1610 family)
MAIDPETVRSFHQKDQAWRQRNRTAVANNPVLVCAKCGWKIDHESARSQGLTACGNCGSRECRIHGLDYKAPASAK